MSDVAANLLKELKARVENKRSVVSASEAEINRCADRIRQANAEIAELELLIGLYNSHIEQAGSA